MKKLLIIVALGASFALPSQAIVCRTAACAKNVRAAYLAAHPLPPKPVVVQPPVVQPAPVFVDTSLCVPDPIFIAGVYSSGCD